MNDATKLQTLADRIGKAASALERAVSDLNVATGELLAAEGEYWTLARSVDQKDQAAERNNIRASVGQLLATCQLSIPRLVRHRAGIVRSHVEAATVALRGGSGDGDA